MFKTILRWLIGSLLTFAVLVFAAAYLHDFQFVRERPQYCAAWDYSVRLIERVMPRAHNADFRVVVARLEFDETGAATRTIVDSLADLPGISPIELCTSLSIPSSVNAVAATERNIELAQDQLTDRHADAFVWGQVMPDEHQIRLRIVTPSGTTDPRLVGLQNELLLPSDLSQEIKETLAAFTLGSVIRATLTYDRYVADSLGPLIPKLRNLVENSQSLSAELQHTIDRSYERALFVMMMQTGDPAWAEELSIYQGARPAFGITEGEVLQDRFYQAVARATIADVNNSIQGFERAINEYRGLLRNLGSGEDDVLRFQTLVFLGDAQSRLGELTSHSSTVRLAISSYLVARNRAYEGGTASDRALILHRLAAAQYRLAFMDDDDQFLRDARDNLMTALTLVTAARTPQLWAEIKQTLGETLVALADVEDSNVLLEDAITSFQDAITQRPRARMTDQWVRSQLALGHAYVRLGTIREDAGSIDGGIRHLRLALGEVSHESNQDLWIEANASLANAYLSTYRLSKVGSQDQTLRGAIQAFRPTSARRESGIVQQVFSQFEGFSHTRQRASDLRQSAEHIRNCLGVTSRGSNPVEWATYHAQIAEVLLEYALVLNNNDHFEEALQHLQQAEVVFTQTARPSEWANLQAMRGRIYASLAIESDDPLHQSLANRSFQRSIDILARSDPYDRLGEVQFGYAVALLESGIVSGNPQDTGSALNAARSAADAFRRIGADYDELRARHLAALCIEMMALQSSDAAMLRRAIAEYDAIIQLTLDRQNERFESIIREDRLAAFSALGSMGS